MAAPRVAFLASHPIQYQAPLFRALADSGKIDLEVLFLSDFGVEASFDPGFGTTVRFDVPLTDGFEHRFVRRLALGPSIQPPFGLINPALIPLLCSSKYDAVVVQGYAHVSDWLAFACAIGTGKQLLLRGETPEPSAAAKAGWRWRLKRAVLGAITRRASACLVIGLRNARFYAALGASTDQLAWAPYSVDSEHFEAGGAEGRRERTAMLDRLGLDPSLPVVLFAAKLIPRKRPLDVIEAMDQLDGRASLVVVGDGMLKEEVDRRAVTRPWMRAIGFVNQAEIPRWYGAADLYVLPSDHETWGLTINEAMSAGCVPIVSDVVGCAPDLVADGAGALFPVGDVDALARAIDGLLATEARAAAATIVRQRIARYNLESTVAGIEAAVQSPHLGHTRDGA